ncbi:hypothetical protein [Nocardioides sp.]|uniref:hypothetical protein n=1 Tax=Nocardioides sp. TaxID=35761 RepID=UPI003527728F
MTVRRTTAALLAAAGLGLGLAGPAAAATIRVDDGDDTAIKADILRVAVKHDARLKVKVHFDDLLKHSDQRVQGLNVYVDTGGGDPQPELMMEAGLWKGADHVVARTGTGGWGLGQGVDCFSRLRVDWQAETAVAVFGHGCLGKHPKARVAVVAYESTDDGSGSDWLLGRRTFTRWVKRG